MCMYTLIMPIPERKEIIKVRSMYILRDEIEKYKQEGFLGPFTVKIDGRELTYMFNAKKLQDVINIDGRCPCKNFDRCLCRTFLTRGLCVCKLFILVVNSPEEFKKIARGEK